jgi:hypothetical protein
MSCDQLVVSEEGRVSILSLDSGEVRWRSKTSGELVVAADHLLVPRDGQSSTIYSLRDSAVTKVRTRATLARPARPGVRMLDGTVVPAVTSAGAVVLLDLVDSVELEGPASVRPVERAWLAGTFLITNPPLSVSHLWGGVATQIPFDVDPAVGALIPGPGQALLRGVGRCAWLEFS